MIEKLYEKGVNVERKFLKNFDFLPGTAPTSSTHSDTVVLVVVLAVRKFRSNSTGEERKIWKRTVGPKRSAKFAGTKLPGNIMVCRVATGAVVSLKGRSAGTRGN